LEKYYEEHENCSQRNLSYCKLKQHKLWFEEAYSKVLDQRRQAKLQWLKNPILDNIKNVKCETRTFMKKQGNN
jgi:hypothetical protein